MLLDGNKLCIVFFEHKKRGTVRNSGVVYYVDGVKQRDSDYKIPSTAVASIMVYMGDVPAKYGDFDGGVVVVETKSYFDLEAERMAAKKR